MNVSTIAERPPVRALLFTLAGPIAAGACLGLPHGAAELVARSACVPVIFLAVALVTVPALYVVSALSSAAPPAQVVLQSARAALEDTSVVLLSLAPALAFLIGTSVDPAAAERFGVPALALATILGLRSLYLRLYADRPKRPLLSFTIWACLFLGLCGRMLALILSDAGGI